MADLGKTSPGFENGDPVRIWRVPIAVFDDKTGDRLGEITAIYEDEGFLCIDVKVADID